MVTNILKCARSVVKKLKLETYISMVAPFSKHNEECVRHLLTHFKEKTDLLQYGL